MPVKTRWTRSGLLLLAATGLLAGCELDGYEEEEVGSTEQELFLTGMKWPQGKVPVCWSESSLDRDDFGALSRRVRDLLNASWPAVADVEFTGWGACPEEEPDGMVNIRLNDGTDSSADVGWRGDNLPHTVNLGVDRPTFFGGVVPHEFGHVLGFAHEMRRPDFVDESFPCREDNYAGGDTLGTPVDRDSIMTSSYCHNNPFLTRWDIKGVQSAYGNRADNVISAGTNLYARKRSTGDIYRRSGSSWVQIGSPGAQFIAVGTTLYGLTPGGEKIFRYEGTGMDWTELVGAGGGGVRILRCGSSLCRTTAYGGLDVYISNGVYPVWKAKSDLAAEYVSTSTGTYRLSADRQLVEVNTGAQSWSVIGGPMGSLVATTTALYGTDLVTGEILRYTGGTSWTVVGGPGRMWVGVGAVLYGLTPDRKKIYRHPGTGTSWTEVGGAADWIYGGPSGSLYSVNPTTKDIWRYDGSSWVNLGQP